MKNRRYCLLGLLGIGLWASGCNRAQPLPSDYFGGEFVCYDDTARFFDCATGRTYLLDRSGAYPEVVANYEQMRPAPHERVHMFCHAEIRQEADSSNGPVRMVVREPFGFDRATHCDPNGLIAGMYRSNAGGGEGNRMLHLRGDYTYTVVRFTETTEQREDGRWGLSSESELVLNPQEAGRPQRRFEILFEPETLVANDGLGQLTYQKVDRD